MGDLAGKGYPRAELPFSYGDPDLELGFKYQTLRYR